MTCTYLVSDPLGKEGLVRILTEVKVDYLVKVGMEPASEASS